MGMHEWALAEAVIATVYEIAEKEGFKEVKEVTIIIGELQQIDLEIFKFALNQLKPEKFKNTKFDMATTKAELRCKVCGHKWIFRKETLDENTAEALHFLPEVAHAYIKCPKCGSRDFEIVKGRGVWLKSVKGEK